MPTPLQRFLVEQIKHDREMRRILIQAANTAADRISNASDRGVGARIRAGQLTLVLSQLRNDQINLWTKEIGPLIEKYFPRVSRVAEQAVQSIDRLLASTIGERYANVLKGSVQAQSGAGITLDRARRSRDLSVRVFRNADLMSGRIERTIRASILLGDSAREIAREVKQFIHPNTRGGVSYAAMRLGRTELNNAFHERQKQEGQDRPWVKGMQWNLSGSHPHKDICNVYAETVHIRGRGVGVFLADEVLDKPHPQCLCYMTYVLVSQDEAVQMALAAIQAA